MVFASKISNFQMFVRSPLVHYHPDTGVPIGEVKGLVASFGEFGQEYEFVNTLTGGTDLAVDIRGHFFDTIVAQEKYGWTDEERETVELVLERQCAITPEWVWVHSEQVVIPDAPWKTYDKTHALKIAGIADDLGVVAEAIAYEKATKNRESVIEALEKKSEEIGAEQALSAV